MARMGMGRKARWVTSGVLAMAATVQAAETAMPFVAEVPTTQGLVPLTATGEHHGELLLPEIQLRSLSQTTMQIPPTAEIVPVQATLPPMLPVPSEVLTPVRAQTPPAAPSLPAQPQTPKPTTEAPTKPPASSGQQGSNSLLDLDLESLSKVEIRDRPKSTPTGTGSVVTSTPNSGGGAPSTVGELLEQAPSVNVRRTSAINLDPRIRGFHALQLNASANGMNQLKTRIDIDSLFSQIDPGNVANIRVIDGPYSSLYGPGFAFLAAELQPAPRHPKGMEWHGSTLFSYESNGGRLYTRERIMGGAADWGLNLSYGFRGGNDYRAGGDDHDDFKVPASYHQQDVFFAYSQDLLPYARLEFNYLRQNLSDVELPGIAYDINRSITDQFNVRLVFQEGPNEPERLVLQYWSQHTAYNGDANHVSKHLVFSDLLIGQATPGLLGGSLTNNGLSESQGLRALTTFGDKDDPQLTLGVDWRRYRQSYTETDRGPDGTVFFGGNIFGIPRSSMEDFGVLAHLNIPVQKDLTATVGGRLDRTQPFLTPGEIVTQVIAPLPDGEFRPGFEEPINYLGMGYGTMEYKANTWLTLNAGAGYAMRNASLAELYTDEPYVPIARFGNAFPDGNSHLRPEKNLQFDLGLTGKWAKQSFGVRAFQSTIYDYIMPVPSSTTIFQAADTPAPTLLGRDQGAFGFSPLTNPGVIPNLHADNASLGYRYLNVDHVTLYGGELFGEAELLPWLSLTGSVAYVKGTNNAPVRFIDVTHTIVAIKGAEGLPGINPLTSSIGVRVFEPRANRWSVEFVTRLVAGQHFVADSLTELPSQGYTVFGLNGSYQINKYVRLFSSFDNLLDRVYSQPGSLAIMNRQGMVSFVKEPGFSWTTGFEAKY